MGLGLFRIAGCSPRGPDLGRVQGRVTLDGIPLAGAAVMFVPEEGRPATARTGVDGSYRLEFTSGRFGALLGPHVVRITTAEPAREEMAEDGTITEVPAKAERLPSEFNTKSLLEADVQPGQNTFDFNLSSP